MSKHVRDWNTIVDTKPSPKTVKGYAAGGTTASKTATNPLKLTTLAKAPAKTTATPTKTTTPTKTATPTKTTSTTASKTATPTKTTSTATNKTPTKTTSTTANKTTSTTASKTTAPNKTTSTTASKTSTPPVNDRSIGSTTSKGLTSNADAKSTSRANVNTGVPAGSQTTPPPVVNKAIADAVANKPVDLGLSTVVDTKPPATGLGVGPLVPDALAEAQKTADAKAVSDKAAADKAAADKATADKAASDAMIADLKKQMDDMKAAYETQRTQYQSSSEASLADLKKQIADMQTAQQAEKDRIASEKAAADKAAADKVEADRQAAEAAKSKPFDIDQFKNLLMALGAGPQVAQAQPVQQQPKTQVTQFDPFYSGFNASRPPVQQPLMSMDQQGQFMFGTGTQTPFSGFGFQNAYVPKETQNTGNP